MYRSTCALVLYAALAAAPAWAQHGHQAAQPAQPAQPYAGQQQRSIKALSDDEVKQYLSGAGMGYAKAAELNRYPGPLHALELAEKLELDATQRQRIEAMMAAHKAHARALGAEVVEAERRLEAVFSTGNASDAELAQAVRAAAAAQGEYRLSHLETHRRLRPLLSDEQVARYHRLRGYDSAAAHTGHHGRH